MDTHGIGALCEPEVGAGDDVLPANQAGEILDAPGDEFRVLDHHRVVCCASLSSELHLDRFVARAYIAVYHSARRNNEPKLGPISNMALGTFEVKWATGTDGRGIAGDDELL